MISAVTVTIWHLYVNITFHYMKVEWPEVKSTTSQSLVKCPNHYTTMPHWLPYILMIYQCLSDRHTAAAVSWFESASTSRTSTPQQRSCRPSPRSIVSQTTRNSDGRRLDCVNWTTVCGTTVLGILFTITYNSRQQMIETSKSSSSLFYRYWFTSHSST